MRARQCLATYCQFQTRSQLIALEAPAEVQLVELPGADLLCCLFAYTIVNVNLTASLIGHADHRLLGGGSGGALGGVVGRWAKDLDGLDCPGVGRCGLGDIPLS